MAAAQVARVLPNGVVLVADSAEYFLPFDEYPWFRSATVAQITNVQRPHPEHLHWPDLDVDLELDNLRYPERYPLVARQ